MRHFTKSHRDRQSPLISKSAHLKCSRKKHFPSGLRSPSDEDSIGRISVMVWRATSRNTANQMRNPASDPTMPSSRACSRGLCAKCAATVASAQEKNMMKPSDSVDTANSHITGASAASRHPIIAVTRSPTVNMRIGFSVQPERQANTYRDG